LDDFIKGAVMMVEGFFGGEVVKNGQVSG